MTQKQFQLVDIIQNPKSSHQMKNNTSISKVNEPVRLIKPKICQVSLCFFFPKVVYPTHVEEFCNVVSNHRGLFHSLVFLVEKTLGCPEGGFQCMNRPECLED